MKTIQFIQALLAEAEEYQKSSADLSIKGFSLWLQNKTENQSLPPFTTGKLEGDLFMQLVDLFKFGKGYAKLALENSDFNSIEEFTFLIALLHSPPLNKSELIEMNLMEKTSGTEVIKRLIQKKFIQEQANPNDKRQKLLALTDLGKAALFASTQNIEATADIVAGNLSKKERENLWYLLNKLRLHHLDFRKKLKEHGVKRFEELKDVTTNSATS